MKKLPLYPRTALNGISSAPQAAVGLAAPRELDHGCALCPEFNEKTRSKCMSPEGASGGLLVVGEWPDRVADQTGRPFTGPSGKTVRDMVKQHWRGPVAYDHAIKCSPGILKLKDKHFDNCRPYGAAVLQDVQPTRIICLGWAAMVGVLGRGQMMQSVRRGYGWWMNDEGVYVPVFLMLNPAQAARNRFMQAAFLDDLKWALKTSDPVPHFDEMITYLVDDRHGAKRAVKELRAQPWMAYDVETFGKMGNADFRIEACTLLGADSTHAWTWTRSALQDPKARSVLRDVLQTMPVGTQSGTYDDRAVLTYLGANVRKTYSDSRLLRKLDDFEASAKLEVIAELVGMGGHKGEAQAATAAICKELNYQSDPPSGTTPTGRTRAIKEPAFYIDPNVLRQVRNGAEPMAFAYGYMEERTLYRYNARDVYSTREAIKLLKPRIDSDPGLKLVWKGILHDASHAVRWIEHWGFAADRSAMKHFADYCTAKEAEALIKLRAYGDFNPASPIQLEEFLFKKLGLKHHKTTDSGRMSTDREVLDDLAGKHPAVDHLLQFRKYSKLNGTYASGLLRHIRDDGRIHATYLLDGAGTGRLSSADPNMQNAPRAKGSPEGKMLRDCFIAPDGYVIVEADQSQVELRIAAMLSGDKVMISDYVKGIDIHRNNARLCCTVAWGIPLAKWDGMTKDEQDPYRTKIKTATFGRLYGKTLRGLAHEFGCSVQEVEKLDKAIWGRYSRLAAWTEECVRESRKSGETRTWWHGQDARRRRIWSIADGDEGIREHAERTAYNTKVQGTAADFTTASLWPIVSWILEEGIDAKVVATIHDSIVLQVHKSVLAEVIGKVRGVMTGHPAGGVPLVADFKVGVAWGSMEDYKP